jgi:hypothetical protein
MTRRGVAQWLSLGLAAQALAVIFFIPSLVGLLAHFDELRAAGGSPALFGDDYSRTMASLMGVGILLATVGAIAEFVTWIVAVLTLRQLGESRWSRALFWTGIVGIATLPLFGIGSLIAGSAVLAYLVGGPDRASNTHAGSWSKVRIQQWSRWGLVPLLLGGTFPLVVANLGNPGGPLHGQTWLPLALVTTGFAVAFAGVIVEAVAWWAALFNAHQLADRTWFNVLAWGGLIGAITLPLFGLGALILIPIGIAYELSAPDTAAGQKAPITVGGEPEHVAAQRHS